MHAACHTLRQIREKQRQLQRHSQALQRCEAALRRLSPAVSLSDQRRQATRTKIQMGGLVVTSGLAKFLHLKVGDDLQQDPAVWPQATLLLGALTHSLQQAQADETLLTTWRLLGESVLRRHFQARKKEGG